MITELGIIAGDIWHYLDEHGRARLTDLVSALDKPRETILMSLGWLAREGHVKLEPENSDYQIELRK
ncbi:MAG: winged helix-turn-helix domain-containing protein [Candidatus Omnitrophica bacterium]|nr:winged helix-turn-helix domain-containing protein [Candidatus Omnitrophota bacterium]